MSKEKYPEIQPGCKPVKKAYVSILLFVVGRAIQAAAKIDRDVKKEFAGMENNFLFCMRVNPNGPAMYVGKTAKGKVKYYGRKMKDGRKPDLDMLIKNVDGAVLMFTFQESTAAASCANRLVLSGNIPTACAVVRILNFVEVYLLPKCIASLAVKRYPKWSEMNPFRKHFGRVAVYLLTVLGI